MADTKLTQAPRLQTGRQVVDTFAVGAPGKGVPKPAQTNTFQQLAESLAAIQPGLTQFIDKTFEGWTEDQVAKAEEDFKKNQLAWKDLVTKAPELRGANPWYRRAYQGAHMRQASRQLKAQLEGELARNPEVVHQGKDGEQTVRLLDTDDPAAVQAWMHQQTNKWMEKTFGQERDPILWRKNIAPILEETEQGLLRQHTISRMEFYQKEMPNKLSTEVTQFLEELENDSEWQGGDEEKRKQLLGAYATRFKGIIDEEYVANGMNPSEANRAMAKAVLAHVEHSGEADLAGIIEQFDTGYGSLSEVADVRASIDSTLSQLDDRAYRNWQRTVQTKEYYQKQQADRIKADAYAQLIQSKGEYDLSADVEELRKAGDPEAISALTHFQEHIRSARANVQDDPAAVTMLYRKMFQGGWAFEEAASLVGTRVSTATFGRMLDDARSMGQHQEQWYSSRVRSLASDIESIMAPKGIDGLADPKALLMAQEAANYFQEQVYDRITDLTAGGTQPTSQAKISKAIQETYQEVMNLDHYKVVNGETRPNVFRPDQVAQAPWAQTISYMPADVRAYGPRILEEANFRVVGPDPRQALQEFEQSGGQGGVLADLAKAHGYDPEAFAKRVAAGYGITIAAFDYPRAGVGQGTREVRGRVSRDPVIHQAYQSQD